MSNFKLNTQQQLAVDHTEGALLVLAGPGTGKTQLLSARAAHILKSTDSRPENILALTYTEKAAQNMRERLLSAIGVEGRKIVVKTFHGLGVELINMYPEYFWQGARLQPAPAAVELEIIELILQQLPHDHPYALMFYGQFTSLGRARSQISQAKKAGLTPNKLAALARHNVASLEALQDEYQELLNTRMSQKLFDNYRDLGERAQELSSGFDGLAPFRPVGEVLSESLNRAVEASIELGKTKPLSDWKSEWSAKAGTERVFKDVKRSQAMVALSEVYDQFQDEMFTKGYYDFDDMILEVIAQLEQHEDFRAQVQERFTHIMIDEFQDTNDAQFRLSYLIASHPAQEGRPNIMAVGDDDQAIYRFQGAQLSNIDNFTKSFTGTKEIVLTENYRSHQMVIDAAAKTADLIDFRLVDLRENLTKDIKQAADVPKGAIKHFVYQTEAEQLSGMVEAAQEAFEGGQQVAVLSRSHAPLEAIAALFHDQNIPVSYSRRSDVLQHNAVQLVLNISRLILSIQKFNKELTNELVVDIVGHPVFGIDPAELWQVGVEVRRNRRDADWLSILAGTDSETIRRVISWLHDLAVQANEQPAGVMLDYILGLRPLGEEDTQFSVRNYYLEQDSRYYLEALSAIHKLRSLVNEFSQKPHPDLHDFVSFMELNINHRVKITDESTFVSSDHAIELMSVHASKGLEFDHVFVIDAVESSWRPGGVRFRPPANLEAMRPHGDVDDDYARLMYVALTRAKSSITASSYRTDAHGRAVMPTPFVDHIEKIEVEQHALIEQVIERYLRWPEPPKLEQKQLLAPILSTYKMPVTHLLNFIDVTRGGPEEFIERNLLRLPSVKTASLAYGTAMHDALEFAQRKLNADKSIDLEQAQEAYKQSLVKQQLPVHDEKLRLSQGLELLGTLLRDNTVGLVPGDQPERVVSGVQLESGAIISGKLDVVRNTEEGMTVIDYKTGGGVSGFSTNNKKEQLKALKHQLQLTFYALLMRQSGSARANQKICGEMIYVEEEKVNRFRVAFEPSEDDIRRLELLIGAVWLRVQQLDWPDISAYTDDYAGVNNFIEDLISENR